MTGSGSDVDDVVTVADAVSYTRGRLTDDTETQNLVTDALAAVRKYCGWHVAPVHTAEGFVLDGMGGHILSLPTMQLLDLIAVTDDDVILDPDTELDWSELGLVVKKSGARWSKRYGSIRVTMTHGFAQVPGDWRAAVLRIVDRAAVTVGVPGDAAGAGPYSISVSAPGSAIPPEMYPDLEPYKLRGVW